MNPEIRTATEADTPQILSLLKEFAEFEKLSQFCEVTAERLHAGIFAEDSVAEAIVAAIGETVIAYAVFYPNFSTFRGQKGLYLEDLYISPDGRGKNLGENMLKYIARLGRSRGFERIDFQVLNWNSAAIGFYKKLGAVVDETESHFKFTDDAFKKLTE